MDEKKLRKQLQLLVRRLNERENERRDNLVGKVLTITDAAIAGSEQRKAVKDLVQQAFWGNSSPGEKSPVEYTLQEFARAYGIEEIFERTPASKQFDVPEPNEYADVK